MSTITLTISVSDPQSLVGQYSCIKVYRSSLGATGDFVEVSTQYTRVPLIGSLSNYEFDDTNGDASYYYKTSFYNSTSGAESDLSAPVKGDLCGDYVSVQDLREDGYPSAQMSDMRAFALIQLWEDFVNQNTGQWFCPRAVTLELDGTNSALLQLPVPTIRIDAVYLNGSSQALPASQYVVYNRYFPDDRMNPKLKIKSAAASEAENFYAAVGGDLYGTLYSTLYGMVFKRGERNQRLVGLFGYVEQNGTPPPLIKYAVRKLIAMNAQPLALGGATSLAGPLTEEVTDRHKMSYSDKMLPSATLTGDPEVDRILARYRRAMIIDMPYGEII